MTPAEGIVNVVFYLLAGFMVASALAVALSRNIVRTAFALLAVLFSAAGMYALMKADFIFAIQVLVYVGGILVLIIFAIMLTHKIVDLNVSNPSVPTPLSFLAVASILVCLAWIIVVYAPDHTVFQEGAIPVASGDREGVPSVPMTAEVGKALMTDYLYPFEILSVLLLAALIGAAFLARKEVRR